MLVSSKKQKGKLLEKFVSSALEKIYPYAYSRADSGSGKFHKEDVSLPREVPLHIECKNQAELQLETWWKQTVEGCPQYKYPVLIYRLNFQKVPTVYMRFDDLLSYISNQKIEMSPFRFCISLSFNDFLKVLQEVWMKKMSSQ